MQGEFENVLPISLDVINGGGSGGSGGRSSSPGVGYGSTHINSERSVWGYIDTMGGRLCNTMGTSEGENDGRVDDGSDDEIIISGGAGIDNIENDSMKTGLKSRNMMQKWKNNNHMKNRRGLSTKKRHRTSPINSKSRSSLSTPSLSPRRSSLHPLVLLYDMVKPVPFPCRLLLTLRDRTKTRKEWWRQCVITINDHDEDNNNDNNDNENHNSNNNNNNSNNNNSNNNNHNHNSNNNQNRLPQSTNSYSMTSVTSPVSVLLSESQSVDLSFPLDLPLRPEEDMQTPIIINHSSEVLNWFCCIPILILILILILSSFNFTMTIL